MNRYEGSPAVIIERRKGTPDSPFSNMNESLVVSNDGKVILSEIPNELNRVIVTSDDIVTWYEVTEGQIPENGFKVDYINKIVTFNTINVGKQLHFKYLGEGNHYYSPNSIYTKLNEGSVVETLGGLIENSHEALDALERLDEKLNEVTQATTNAITATNDTKEVITEGNQVIVSANGKITEMDDKISEATTKISELDTKLNQAETTISDVQQKSTMVEAIINDGQEVIDNAELLVNEVKSAGKFNLSTLYKKNNTVLDNGSTWIALQDTQNNSLPVLPIVENTYWRLAALHGLKGDKGDTGAALSILGKLTDPSQLPPTGQAGQAYTVNGELYVWSENLDAWENVGNIKGEKGDKGDTGEDGLSAYEVAVLNGFVGTSEEWLASLKGEKGDKGRDADLTEVNQEIANLQQTVSQNQQVVTEHLAEMKPKVDNSWQKGIYNDTDITNLGEFNVKRSFMIKPSDWVASDSNLERLSIAIPAVHFSGIVKVTYTCSWIQSNAEGGAEVVHNYAKTTDVLRTYSKTITSISNLFANHYFIVDCQHNNDAFTIPIVRTPQGKNYVTITVELYTTQSMSMDMLKNATLLFEDLGTSWSGYPWTPQKSNIPTNVDFSNWNSVAQRLQPKCTVVSDWNMVKDNGFYMGDPVAQNAPTKEWWMGFVTAHNDLYVIQKVINVTGGSEFERQCFNGVWENWIETSPRKLFQSVSNGKATVNQAVTDMGVYTPPDATFATTAANIRAISGKRAKGRVTVTSNRPGYVASYLRIANLGFIPITVVAKKVGDATTRRSSAVNADYFDAALGSIKMYANDGDTVYTGNSGWDGSVFWLQVDSPNGTEYEWRAYGE
ncbi:pyocin knob domain-containing protein [Lysinibacillus sp. FSL K6-0102]|uniref:pyocin knob domain-containing protein n=1 Tax=Lysinibacillus sp. FSL K6-0102 TaxID=2975290 RepID=UPI0030F90EB9